MFGKVKSDELEVRLTDDTRALLRNISSETLVSMMAMASKRKTILEAHRGDNNFFDVRVSDVKEIIRECSNLVESPFKKCA